MTDWSKIKVKSSESLLSGRVKWQYRARKMFLRLTLRTFGDLCAMPVGEILLAKNFGETTLNHIRKELHKLGLYLQGEGKIMSEPAEKLVVKQDDGTVTEHSLDQTTMKAVTGIGPDKIPGMPNIPGMVEISDGSTLDGDMLFAVQQLLAAGRVKPGERLYHLLTVMGAVMKAIETERANIK